MINESINGKTVTIKLTRYEVIKLCLLLITHLSENTPTLNRIFEKIHDQRVEWDKQHGIEVDDND